MDESIMFIAKDFFYSKGYFNTTISDITKKRGIAPGSFYRYYNSKEDLLREIIKAESEDYIEELREIGTQHNGDLNDKIQEILNSNLNLIFKKPHFFALLQELQIQNKRTDSSTKRILNSISSANKQTLEKILTPVQVSAQKKNLICQLISTTIITFKETLINDSNGNCCPDKIPLLNFEKERRELTQIISQMCKGLELTTVNIIKVDPLTNTYTSEYFKELLIEASNIYTERNLPINIIFLDIPSLAHLTKDKSFFLNSFLKDLGVELHHAFRSGDIIGRITSSSFMIILPDYQQGSFKNIAKRLKKIQDTLKERYGPFKNLELHPSILSIPADPLPDLYNLFTNNQFKNRYVVEKIKKD